MYNNIEEQYQKQRPIKRKDNTASIGLSLPAVCLNVPSVSPLCAAHLATLLLQLHPPSAGAGLVS
jgi:hypothetical protein